jgi:hypothetical protein
VHISGGYNVNVSREVLHAIFSSDFNTKYKEITSPCPFENELAPSSKDNKMDCTSDGALSKSSNTTQNPF